MNKAILFALIILSNILIYSQDTTQKTKKFNIGVSIMEDPGILAWQINGISNSLHAEYYLGNRRSIALSVGNIISLKSTENVELIAISSLESANGIKIQAEYRKYLNRTKRILPAYLLLPHLLQFNSMTNENNGYYISGSIFLLNTELNRRQSFNNVESLYQVHRIATGTGFKIGYMCQYKFGLTLDLSFGFGIQYISSSNENRLIDENTFPAWENESISNKLIDSGSKIGLYLTQLFKLGWSF